MANWFTVTFQVLARRPQSAVVLRKASQISLVANSSLGEVSPRLDVANGALELCKVGQTVAHCSAVPGRRKKRALLSRALLI